MKYVIFLTDYPNFYLYGKKEHKSAFPTFFHIDEFTDKKILSTFEDILSFINNFGYDTEEDAKQKHSQLNYKKSCIVDYDTIKDLLSKNKKIYSKMSGYTGFKDVNGTPIYVGNTIKEGCNGLISTVVWDEKKGTYKLKGLGDYYIEDAPIEWEVIDFKEKELNPEEREI